MRHPALRPRVLVLWLVAAIILLSVPTLQQQFNFPVYNLIFLYFVFFWVTQATSWNMFCGYAGYFSFGQSAFYGAGLYAIAILVSRFDFGLLPALPVAALVGGLIAFVSGLLVFRLRRLSGEIFALFTFVVALGLGALANNWEAIDGGRGIPLGKAPYPDFLGSTTEMLYYLGLVLALVTVFLAYVIQNSRFGFGLFAIRDDEKVAEAIGVPTFRFKLMIFTLSGAIAGVSGGLHAVQVNFISPASAFGLPVALFVILMSVVGGRRHWLGPVLGAVVIYTITERLTGMGLAELSQILLGLVLIVATLFLPHGIAAKLLERPAPALVVGGATFVILTVVDVGTVLSEFALGMLAALVVLFVPERVFVALRRRRVPVEAGPAGPASAEETDAPAETRQLRSGQ